MNNLDHIKAIIKKDLKGFTRDELIHMLAISFSQIIGIELGYSQYQMDQEKLIGTLVLLNAADDDAKLKKFNETFVDVRDYVVKELLETFGAPQA